MKKSVIFVAIFFLFIVPIISAVEFQIKEEFKQGETFVAKLSGQFTKTPLKENIEFFRGHVRIATDHEVAKIGDDFYIFASLTGKDSRDDYSIVISEVRYRQGGEDTNEDLVKNFSITNETADFSVNKGFISTNDDFKLTLDNLGDEKITITLNVETLSGNSGGLTDYEDNKDYDLTVNPGQRQIEFTLGPEVRSSIKSLSLKSENQNYTIPLSIFIEEEPNENLIFAFDIAPNELELTMPTNSNVTKLVYIYNTGTGRLSDVELKVDESLKPYVTISEDSFGQILPGSNANLQVGIASGGEQSLGGDIVVQTAEGITDSIRVSLNFVADYVPSEDEQQQDLSTTETCEEIGGNVCIDNEECTGDHVFAKNQFCCIGDCVVPVTSSAGKIIGWLILIVVIAVGTWFFFKKYKGAGRKPVNLLKISRGRK